MWKGDGGLGHISLYILFSRPQLKVMFAVEVIKVLGKAIWNLKYSFPKLIQIQELETVSVF